MKMNKIILGTISVLLVFFVSCAKFEKFESKDLASAPTVSLATEEVKDSSVVVSFSSTAPGFLSFALFEGVGNPKPDSALLIQLNIKALDMGSGEVLAAGEKLTYEFAGLTQNTVYEVFAVSQNEDGVLSVVSNALMIKTTDAYDPVLSSSTPARSTTADKAVDFEVVLTFDEPISTADAGKFTFTYFLEGSEAAAASATVNPANPFQVVVKQSRAAHAGDYVFLSYAEGAVKDIVGNSVGELYSGLDEEGYLTGLYWRVARESWSFDVAAITPAAGSAVADPEFEIVLKAPVVVSSKVTDANVRMVLVGAGVKSVYAVPAANVALADDGKTITITKPFVPTYGERVYLEMDAGAFTDAFSNANTTIESGKDGVNPTEAPITEVGWLISYGFERNLVIGNYTFAGVSYWAGADESFDVEIVADPDDANKVIINGFYGSATPIPATFNGDFATLTINAEADYLLGDLFDDGGETYFWSYQETQIVINILANGNLVTDPTYWLALYWVSADGAEEGWVNMFVESTWTKNAGGINIEKSTSDRKIKSDLSRNGIRK
jgi:hypothetical protein